MVNILPIVKANEAQWMADLAVLVGADCGTQNKAGVDAMGAFVAGRCAGWGWEVTRHAQAEFGDCHTATLRGSGKGRIMLMGHLDTVYLDGTVAAHPLRVDGNRLYAPGACDMKGGLLAGMYAMRALQQAGYQGFETITFFFNSEEEMGSPVSQSITRALASGMDAALVFEPARANGAIVSARKAAATFTMTVHGFSTHAGVAPEQGVNAVVAASHYIQGAYALHGCVPGVSVTPSVVHGGTVSNVVPDLCTVQVDCRAADTAGVRAVEDGMRALAAREVVRGTTVECTGAFTFPPMTRTPAVATMADLARDCARALGFALDDVPTGGASDASIIAPLAPVIDGLGPVGGNAHNAALEYIEIDSIVPRTALAALLIERLTQPDTLAMLTALRRS